MSMSFMLMHSKRIPDIISMTADLMLSCGQVL